jgi:ubiquinone/menaquinone biosynthesis C-methylase UbiE
MEATEAASAFSRQAPVFDGLNSSNAISRHLREQFREEVMAQSADGSSILELNCGTGLDAIYFSAKGRRVLATDISKGMLAELERKCEPVRENERPETMLLSFEELDKLSGRKFDHIISDFGGLNCSPDLRRVLRSFDGLLNKGGKVTLMIMPRVCPWEMLMAIKGKFRTAFRRVGGSAPARIEGQSFTCYYYNPGYVIRALKRDFKVVTLRGICITVPPEFYLGFAERYPRAFAFLRKIDRAIGGFFPFNRLCDHYLITLEKR